VLILAPRHDDQAFFISTLYGGEQSASNPDRLTPGKARHTHFMRGSVDPEAGLNAVMQRRITALERNKIPVVQPAA
jgi:hypothetical protein